MNKMLGSIKKKPTFGGEAAFPQGLSVAVPETSAAVEKETG